MNDTRHQQLTSNLSVVADADLPEGWEHSTLGAIGQYLNGRAFKTSEWSKKGRPIIRIQDLTGTKSNPNYFQGQIEDRYVVRPGDFLISWSATLGAYLWDGPEGVLNQHIFKVRSYIDKNFHRRLVQFIIDDLYRETHGSGMVHITKGNFADIPVSIPPAHEQLRIVAKIEELLAQVNSARTHLTRVARILKRFRQAVLAAACSGALVQNDGASTDSLPWEERALRAVLCEPLRNGHSARASQGVTGIRTLTLSAVTYGDFSERNTKITVAEPRKVSGLWLQPGDILIERSNTPELVGTARLYKGTPNFAIFPDLLIRVRVNRQIVLPEFVEFCLQTVSARKYFMEHAQGTSGTMPKIDQQTINEFPLSLPSLDVQYEIVRRVEALFAHADAIEKQVQAAAKRADKLTQAILAKAFRGELVPTEAELARRERRTYEPAAVLLENIRKKRTIQDSKSRRSQKLVGETK